MILSDPIVVIAFDCSSLCTSSVARCPPPETGASRLARSVRSATARSATATPSLRADADPNRARTTEKP